MKPLYFVYMAMGLCLIIGGMTFLFAYDCSLAAYMLGGAVGYLHVLAKKWS